MPIPHDGKGLMIIICVRLDRMPTLDGQTDGQADKNGKTISHRAHTMHADAQQQEAQLMLTTGSTRLLAVSRARAISDGTLT